MSEIKDPAIKLFGKTIPLPEGKTPAESGEKSSGAADLVQPSDTIEDKDFYRETTAEVEDPATTSTEELTGMGSSSSLHDCKEEDPQNPNVVNKVLADSKLDEEHIETDSNHEKVLKKPDKVLPCPRCNSLDTKFCYYNNYNVNQPRHFCKNCQRYWTAGGTMRNVPVGAGRRKNKQSASHYRHIMMSDGMATARVETSDPTHHQVIPCGLSPPTRPLKGGSTGTVLKFGPDAPLCESMATVLNLGDQTSKRNVEVGSVNCGENGEELSCGSSVTAPTSRETELAGNAAQVERGPAACCKGLNPHHMQCYPGAPPWPYTWNPPAWNNVATMAAARCPSGLVYGTENGNPNQVQWSSPPMMAAPAFCAPTVPFPFMPASYWGCVPGWTGGTWPVPWVGPNGSLSPSSSNSNSGCSGNGSSTLGKHSRDTNLQGAEKPERCVWVPKTLRIDDPDEAAKCSIWETLGIKNDQSEPITKGGIFKAFQPKTEGTSHSSEAAQVLQANPAALSRSQTFQEST